MKTGMVIVNYNGYKDTLALINNIKDYKLIDYIVIVDNNSTNNSYQELIKIADDHIDIIKEDNNKGYGTAINDGSKKIIEILGKCNIIISNPDIVIYNEKDLLNLIKYIKDDVVIVAPTIKEGNGLNRGWKIPTPMQDVKMNIPLLSKRFIKKYMYYNDSHYSADTSLVEVVSGCFLIISSEHLENMLYFDEKVFLYYEENIIGVKTKHLGKKMIVCNNINVYHNHSTSIDKTYNKKEKVRILKKSQYYFQKYYNKANIFERFLLKFTSSITRILGIALFK